MGTVIVIVSVDRGDWRGPLRRRFAKTINPESQAYYYYCALGILSGARFPPASGQGGRGGKTSHPHDVYFLAIAWLQYAVLTLNSKPLKSVPCLAQAGNCLPRHYTPHPLILNFPMGNPFRWAFFEY